MRNARLCLIGPFEFPHVFAVARSEVEAWQTGEVGRFERFGQVIGQLRARYDLLRALAQYAHRQITVFERREPHTNCDIDAFADDIHTARCGLQFHCYERVGIHVARDHRTDLEADQSRRSADTNEPLRGGARTVDDFLCGFRLDHHRHAMAIVFPAEFGDREFARRALDQANAEPLFERDDAPADLRSWNAERAAGRCVAAVLDDLREVVEIIEVLHA